MVFQIFDASGHAVGSSPSASDSGGGPRLSVSDLARDAKPFTAAAAKGSGTYRVAVRQSRAGTLVIAMSLSDTDASVRRLVLIEATVIGVVLLLLGLASAAVVRHGLRPLERIATTADAIAGGDLGQRVTVADGRTEVGRLGEALNSMLGRIEHAFSQQSRSEARLRAFVADASHELRTPLTSIRGYSELIRNGAASSPQDVTTAASRIEAESTRLGVLVDDLLLLARLDEGRPLEEAPVDLTAIVSDAVSDARAGAPDRVITLSAAANGTWVHGDGARMRQVVTNLLANAVHHTPAGTPVEVALQPLGTDGAQLVVIDHGPGIAAADVDRVFERFARLDPSRTRASGGTGLGLAIVRAIVEAHHGTITVGATAGGGATFVVALPPAGDRSEPFSANSQAARSAG
jgi:two-component system OmpR family sensor kinase